MSDSAAALIFATIGVLVVFGSLAIELVRAPRLTAMPGLDAAYMVHHALGVVSCGVMQLAFRS